jgi:glucose/mannose-6-phosphate isomerase
MIADVDTLDDARALQSGGAGTMLALIAGMGAQLVDGYRAAKGTRHLPAGDGLRSVVVCGMGGSGIAGDIVRSLYWERLTLPFVVVKGYRLPEFCGRETLVMAASFSGETEETLAAYTEAVDRGCRVVAVSSGGALARLARDDRVLHVRLPAEVAVPRAALGFAAGVPMGILEAMELVPSAAPAVDRTARQLDLLASRLSPSRPVEENEAKGIAAWIADRTPVVWGSEGPAEAASLRWKTQFNENAKGPAFASDLPELDHNEVEGWSRGAGEGYVGIALRHRGEHPRIGPRLAATVAAIAGSGLEVREVHAEGSGPMDGLFTLAMTGDFVSTYLGVLRGVDPLAVPVLEGLKERLRR